MTALQVRDVLPEQDAAHERAGIDLDQIGEGTRGMCGRTIVAGLVGEFDLNQCD
jgi:hypothetical protein